MDVYEIDAASNTSVDNIRDVIERVQYPPVIGKYKIFIIDEVHMLSTGAFNALLKTLEEPPPHVIFIFATTEVNKVPQTILSRVQRFDFKRLTIDQIRSRLRFICEQKASTPLTRPSTSLSAKATGPTA
jgi:DNA polymerase III, gamma/tau subunits